VRSFFPLACTLALLAGCGTPTIEVCHRLSAAGRCDVPVTELRTGVQHVLVARGLEPTEVEVRLVRVERDAERTLGTRVVRVDARRRQVEVPLTLPLVGDYRVEIASNGHVLVSERLRAPSVPARPVPAR
jgi:hypothetical protein